MPDEIKAEGVSAAVDPLTQARRDREALERFQQMQSGLPAELFRTDSASESRRNAVREKRAMSAARHRQRGTQLCRLPRRRADRDARGMGAQHQPRE